MSVKYIESLASLSHGTNRVEEQAVGEGKKKLTEFLVVKVSFYLIDLELGTEGTEVLVISPY